MLMRCLIYLIAAAFGVLGALAPAAAQQTRGVAAIVNDIVISDYDLEQRMSLFVATSGVRPTPENLERIREQVLRSLVDEMLQLQEAQKYQIKVSPDEVDKAIQQIAQQNNIPLEQVQQVLRSAGVQMATLRTQVAAELAWSKLVQQQLGPRVDITEEEVSEAWARISEGGSRTQFLVSEIFLGVDQPEHEEDVRKGAEQLADQLRFGAPFPAVARQFSQSPSAASGGDIGWVQDGQLAEELDRALHELRPRQFAGPIRSAGGYYILLLRDRREPLGSVATITDAPEPSNDPSTPVPVARVLLPLPEGAPKDLRDRGLELAGRLAQRSGGCEGLGDTVSQIPGAVYMDLGNIRPRDLSPQIRDLILQTEPGAATQPFVSSAGVEVLFRCDEPIIRSIPWEAPTREDVASRLFNQQISMMARRYLRDLRRDAVVETR